MPQKIVEIPGVGNVEFPDSMPDSEIAKVAQKQAQKAQLSKNDQIISEREESVKPQGSAISRFGSNLWNNSVGALPGMLQTIGSIPLSLAPGETGAAARDTVNRNIIQPSLEQFNKAREEFDWHSPGTQAVSSVGHALAAIPMIGPYAANIGEQLGSGDIAGAGGALAGGALLGRAGKEIATNPNVGKAAGGALKGAGKAIVSPDASYHGIPVPPALAGAALGKIAGGAFGHGEVGAVIGGGIPIIKGAISGAREALSPNKGFDYKTPGEMPAKLPMPSPKKALVERTKEGPESSYKLQDQAPQKLPLPRPNVEKPLEVGPESAYKLPEKAPERLPLPKPKVAKPEPTVEVGPKRLPLPRVSKPEPTVEVGPKRLPLPSPKVSKTVEKPQSSYKLPDKAPQKIALPKVKSPDAATEEAVTEESAAPEKESKKTPEKDAETTPAPMTFKVSEVQRFANENGMPFKDAREILSEGGRHSIVADEAVGPGRSMDRRGSMNKTELGGAFIQKQIDEYMKRKEAEGK